MSGRKRIEPGDGSSLKPYAWADVVNRSLLGITHLGRAYAVDYDFFDWDGKVALYRDGVHVARARHPVSFPVDGGRIEFAATFYGVKRAHLVLDGGGESLMSPHPRSGEAWRARLARSHPRLSAVLSAAAIITLVVGLVTGVLAVAESTTHLDPVRAQLGGTFTSPLMLSGTEASVLAVLGILAIVERALSMRHHWLLDADTWWME